MVEIKLKPVGELLVRDPLTRKALTRDGEMKPRNVYWLRRLHEGAVIQIKTKKDLKS